MVDVSGFGVGVVVPGEIPDALGFAKGLEPWPSTIVQDPYARVRVVKTKGSGNRLFQNFERFVVGGNINVNGRKLIGRQGAQPRLVAVGLGAAIAGAQHGEIEYERVEQRKHLYCKAKPNPPDLVPCAVRRQHGRKHPPADISGDDQPDDSKDKGARPSAPHRQDRRKDIESTDDKKKRRN